MPPDRRPSASPKTLGGEVYFEFIQAGAYMRVTAIDAATGIEAVIVGAANTPRSTLENIALNKLKRLLNPAPR